MDYLSQILGPSFVWILCLPSTFRRPSGFCSNLPRWYHQEYYTDYYRHWRSWCLSLFSQHCPHGPWTRWSRWFIAQEVCLSPTGQRPPRLLLQPPICFTMGFKLDYRGDSRWRNPTFVLVRSEPCFGIRSTMWSLQWGVTSIFLMQSFKCKS